MNACEDQTEPLGEAPEITPEQANLVRCLCFDTLLCADKARRLGCTPGACPELES